MSKKTIYSLIFIFLLGVMNSADEIVLQNGHEGYYGCTDTHLRIEGYGVNFSCQDSNYHSKAYLITANDSSS